MKNLLIVQDDERENSLKQICGLFDSGQGRMGVDAVDSSGNLFELKSGTKKSGFSTARDFGLHTIERWRDKHWLFAHGKNYESGFIFENIFYLSPGDMHSWFNKMESDLILLRDVSDMAYDLYKKSNVCIPENLKILKKIHFRGCTLNDPKISMSYIKKNGIELSTPYDLSLKCSIKKDFTVTRTLENTIMNFLID